VQKVISNVNERVYHLEKVCLHNYNDLKFSYLFPFFTQKTKFLQETENLKTTLAELEEQLEYLKSKRSAAKNQLTAFHHGRKSYNLKTYYYEDFEYEFWNETWVYGLTGSQFQRTVHSVESFNVSNHGFQTIWEDRYDGKVYNIYSSLREPFPLETQRLVFQFSVQYADGAGCNGGFLSLYECGDIPRLQTSTSFPLMQFGPDISCAGDKTIVFRLEEDGQKMDLSFPYWDWEIGIPELFTLVLEPSADRKYTVFHNGNMIHSGTIVNVTKLEGFLCHTWKTACRVGINVFQRHGGVIFDDVLITSDTNVAKMKRMRMYQAKCNERRFIHSHKILDIGTE